MFQIIIVCAAILLSLMIINSFILSQPLIFGLHYKENSRKLNILNALNILSVIIIAPCYIFALYYSFLHQEINMFLILMLPIFAFTISILANFKKMFSSPKQLKLKL